MYLAVDGGGTKTAFALVDASGQVLARHQAGGLYHVEIGMDRVAATLGEGVRAVLAQAGATPDTLDYAFFGLPAYGEDRAAQQVLDAIAGAALGHDRYRCGNDMVCSWAGALAGEDGISVIAGTGSMAYGEFEGRGARAGGWGELFSDEGSAFWIAQRGLALFSRMSDGRAPVGPLHALLRERLSLQDDLDLCSVVYGQLGGERSRVAQLSKLVAEAARAGDTGARAIFGAAAVELVQIVDAVRARIGVGSGAELAVSYTGGLFGADTLLLAPFGQALASSAQPYRLQAPRLAPVQGAALYAARLAGAPLDAAALARLSGSQP